MTFITFRITQGKSFLGQDFYHLRKKFDTFRLFDNVKKKQKKTELNLAVEKG